MKTAFALSLVFWLGVVLFATGCSFQVGVDWHGETGVDKRIQTNLVKEKKN